MLTLEELCLSQKQNLFLLDGEINWTNLDELGDLVPGFLHVNRSEDLVLTYLNAEGCNFCDISLEQLRHMGMEFINKYCHPDSLKTMYPGLLKFYQENDDKKIYADFQKVWDVRKKEWVWEFTVAKINKAANAYVTLSVLVSDLNGNTTTLGRLLNDNQFMRENFLRFEQLTRREKQILRLLASGFTSSQIAEQAHISKLTADTHRRNIFLKLEVKTYADLIRYASVFGLI
jgi:LuxR family transcriptional regulator, quorum-sensing system regulator SdiA